MSSGQGLYKNDSTLPRSHRMTRQCGVILKELRRENSHPSADELYDKVRRILPRISLATVYRNLEKLCDLGLIQKHEFSGTSNRFDGVPEQHYHIRCTCCDRVEDAPVEMFQNIEKQLSQATTFKVIGHRLEFVGLCPACSDHMVSPGLEKLYRKKAGNKQIST